MPTTEELNGGFNLGEWEVLPAKGVLRRGDEEVRPEPKVFAVLLALATRDGDLVTKDELIEEVWEGKAFSDEPILRCISLLRGHFGDKKHKGESSYQYVETLQRRGYRLLKRVELHSAAADDDVTERKTAPAGPRMWKLVGGAVALGFLAVAVLTWFVSGPEPEPRSLAILQIDNLSGNPENQYIVESIKNTLARQLSGIPGFTVKNARLRYEYELSAIAERLNVEYLLTGDVQLQGETLKVTYLITRGDEGITTGGGEVSGRRDNLFALQERLAKAVRDDLAGEATPQLITRRPPDSTAYVSYMRGMYALELRFDEDNLEEAIELFQESIRLDEGYGPAYLGLATAYALLPDYRNAPLQETRNLALSTIEKGVAMDASIEDAADAIFGFDYHQKKEWVKSEASYKRAISGSVVDSNAFNWYSRMLASVGRLEDSLDVALRGEAIDPQNPLVISRIAMVYTWLGEYEKASEYFKRANEMGATGPIHVMANTLFLYRTDQVEKSRNLAHESARLEQTSINWVDPVYDALADPGKREEALKAIDLAWSENRIIPDTVMVARTFLGDLDGAMEIARLLELPGEAFSMEMIFIPDLAPLRQHADFLPLVERLGIAGYWDELGCRWDGYRVHCLGS
jgi:DNA-binding winged helix-turn-helix (wHTH) protein/TolB-like protein